MCSGYPLVCRIDLLLLSLDGNFSGKVMARVRWIKIWFKHSYCATLVDVGDFLMHKECLNAIKSRRSNNNIQITKPDKGTGVVIELNKSLCFLYRTFLAEVIILFLMSIA